MYATAALRYPAAAKTKTWDFGLWLLLGLPVIAVLACLAFHVSSYGGDGLGAAGYDEWLPGGLEAPTGGR